MLERLGAIYPLVVPVAELRALLMAALMANFVAKRVVLRIVTAVARRSRFDWDDVVVEHNVVGHLVQVVPALIIFVGIAFVDGLAESLTSAGKLQNFRFFADHFDTETTGFDIVATYPVAWSNGDTTFSLSCNNTDTKVVNPGDNIGETRIREYEQGLPESRYNIQANHHMGDWRFLTRRPAAGPRR